MGNHLAYERFTWFDRQARAGCYPNATTLARRFELFPKTAHRNIEFFRCRLGAPLAYDPARKGYAYPDDSFALPAHQVSQEELLAVLVARSLLQPDEEGPVAAAIRSLGDKLRACLGGSELSEALLDEALSAVAPGHAGCAPDTFATALHALLGGRLLTLAYRPDGGVDLSFPAADLREVQMTVLSFGAEVKVLEPLELRRLVAEEVEKMGRANAPL